MDGAVSTKGTLTIGDLELDVDVVIEGDPLGELPVTKMTLNGEQFRFADDEQQQQVVDFVRDYYTLDQEAYG